MHPRNPIFEWTATKTAPVMKDKQMLMDDLQWRYATKKMDPANPVAAEKVEANFGCDPSGAHVQRFAAI